MNDKNCDVAENGSAPFEKCVLRIKTDEQRLMINLVAIVMIRHESTLNSVLTLITDNVIN